MSRRWLRATITGLALGLTVVGNPASAGTIAVRYVDDDGRAGPGGCGGSLVVPRRIQRAVDASGVGDTVRVCPGTYSGKVVIRGGKDGLRLVAASDTRPTLRPPRSGAAVVLVVRGARGVVIEGLRFLPHGGPGACTELHEYIRVLGDTTVRIADNVFDGIRPYLTSCTRFRSAVKATSPDFTHQRVEVTGNVVRDYRDLAVEMWQDGEDPEIGATLRVTDNRFLIRHPQGPSPRHVQFVHAAVYASFGGRLVIRDNVMRVASASGRMVGFVDIVGGDSLIRRNVAVGVAGGINTTPVNGATRIEDNVLRGRTFRGHPEPFDHDNLVGIYVDSGAHVARNRVTGFPYEGIYSRRAEAVVEDNDFRGNGGIDCRDLDYEVGESWGVWRRNLGHESDPAGLCSPV